MLLGELLAAQAAERVGEGMSGVSWMRLKEIHLPAFVRRSHSEGLMPLP
jgi:hypothetical protein